MKQIPVVTRRGDDQDVRYGISPVLSCGQRFNLEGKLVGEGKYHKKKIKYRLTIVMEASARFINVGGTSPFSPAASSAAASHSERTVPISCA